MATSKRQTKLSLMSQIPPRLSALAIILGVVAIGLYITISRAATSYDLKSYYPNPTAYTNFYLEGVNYRNPNSPVRNVIWFEAVGGNSDVFRLYNSGPEDPNTRCHWDQLSWAGDQLAYAQTHDGCAGNDNDVIFSSPIVFLPRTWDGNPWTRSGSTPVVYKNHGAVACTGTNNYVGDILGWVTLSPGVQAIHWRTTQTTTWTSGSDPSGCHTGSTTHWQENYYLVNQITAHNYPGAATLPGIARSVGGNIDSYNTNHTWDWDIWFGSWDKLPWAVTPNPPPPAPPPPPGTPPPETPPPATPPPPPPPVNPPDTKQPDPYEQPQPPIPDPGVQTPVTVVTNAAKSVVNAVTSIFKKPASTTNTATTSSGDSQTTPTVAVIPQPTVVAGVSISPGLVSWIKIGLAAAGLVLVIGGIAAIWASRLSKR